MIRKSNTSEFSKDRQATTKKYLGNHLGIVVQNNDPDKHGKVKVFVPHVSPSVYAGWNELQEDKEFRFLGENIGSDLTNIIDSLKDILPWAECASPLVGSVGIGRYNSRNRHGSISDANVYGNTEASEATGDNQLNNDGIGEKDAFLYDAFPVGDAFNQTLSGSDGVRLGMPNQINKTSYTYRPNSHSNEAKGTFSIPSVGSHVWVFFKEGDPLKPVYFAAAFSADDWQNIFDSQDGEHGPDYPGAFENQSDASTYDPNSEIYRGKMALNQKGGSIEIINTDNREAVRLSQYHGSHIEMNPFTTSFFSAKNSQEQVMGDKFSTIRGTRNIWVARDSDELVRGDRHIKVGSFSKQAYIDWKALVDEIANTKQLFETRRTKHSETFSEFMEKVSPAQTKDVGGSNDDLARHAPCPLCSSENREDYWKIQYQLGSVGLKDVTSSTNDIWGDISPYQSPTEPELTKPTVSPRDFLGGGPCPVCNGTGKSPSTQDGTFAAEDKDTLIADQLSDLVEDLTELELQMGLGGSEIKTISKHKVETIGLLINDFPSIRVDDVGRIGKSGVRVFDEGVANVQQAYPLVEGVHVDDLPGGSYSLNVCNRFNCLVGAGGISMKSLGPVEISGTITNITGEDINIAADASVNITSRNRVNIAADMITLRNKNYDQVLVDSNLGVAQNVVIGGSVHIEGELTVQHITAPAEVQETEQTRLYGRGVPGKVIGYVRHVTSGGGIEMLPCYGNGEEDSIVTYPHSHTFKNIPLTLTNSADDTRRVGKQCNERYKVGPSPVVNEMKGLQSSGDAHTTDTGTSIT